MPNDNKKIIEILHYYKYRATPSRMTILNMLSEESKPMNAEQMYKKIKNQNIDLVTLYRTLASFEKRGLLRRVNMKKDAAYFELAKKHYHHIICINCDTIENFKNLEIEKILKKISPKAFKFKNIKDHSLELFGLCRICA
jgi:Fur family ferric uptake transcriptional regulator